MSNYRRPDDYHDYYYDPGDSPIAHDDYWLAKVQHQVVQRRERLETKRMLAGQERLLDKQEGQERLGIKRMLTDGVLRDDAGAAPPPSADDAKVARRQEQLAEQLRKDIASAGEAGWRSPFYTGSGYHGTGYSQWRAAREDWTRTGDRQYLAKMLAAVDFDCPPEAPAVHQDDIRSLKQHWRPRPDLIVIAIFIIWIALFILVLL